MSILAFYALIYTLACLILILSRADRDLPEAEGEEGPDSDDEEDSQSPTSAALGKALSDLGRVIAEADFGRETVETVDLPLSRSLDEPVRVTSEETVRRSRSQSDFVRTTPTLLESSKFSFLSIHDSQAADKGAALGQEVGQGSPSIDRGSLFGSLPTVESERQSLEEDEEADISNAELFQYAQLKHRERISSLLKDGSSSGRSKGSVLDEDDSDDPEGDIAGLLRRMFNVLWKYVSPL